DDRRARRGHRGRRPRHRAKGARRASGRLRRTARSRRLRLARSGLRRGPPREPPGRMAALRVTEFTDPACPFAFSAEPARLRLRWLYGDQIDWQLRMVVLSESPDDYVERGFTPERQVAALEAIKSRYGMPIDTRRRPRMMATVRACRAVVAARLHAPD